MRSVSKKPYLMIHPRAGYSTVERQFPENLFHPGKERAGAGILKGSPGKRHEVVDMRFPRPGDHLHQLEGCTLIVVALERQPEDEIDDRNEPVLPAEVDGADDILDGVPPVQEAEHAVAPRLGAEVQARVCTVITDEVNRLLRYTFGAHLAGKRAKVNPAVETLEEAFHPVEAEMDAVRTVGERIRGDKPDIPESRGISADLID